MILATLLLSASAVGAASGATAVGRDLVIAESLSGRVVSVLSNVRIESRVIGDVIVWGGNVSFGPSGYVEGNLSVFGGDVRVPAGKSAPVGGVVSTPGTLLHLYLAEMRRAPWEKSDQAWILQGLRLIALAVWLIVSLTLLYFFGTPFARAAASAQGDWTGSLLAGALGVLTLFLAAAAVLALLPSSLSVPIAILFGALAIAAKIFGMGALFLLLGQKILKNVTPALRPRALATGFAVTAGISLLPLVGPLLWSAASVVAVGIAFLSRFGTPRVRVALP